MCLAIQALIKVIEDKEAEVEIGGITRRISLWLTPEAKVGDYVLVHTGYAIGIVDQEGEDAGRKRNAGDLRSFFHLWTVSLDRPSSWATSRCG